MDNFLNFHHKAGYPLSKTNTVAIREKSQLPVLSHIKYVIFFFFLSLSPKPIIKFNLPLNPKLGSQLTQKINSTSPIVS